MIHERAFFSTKRFKQAIVTIILNSKHNIVKGGKNTAPIMPFECPRTPSLMQKKQTLSLARSAPPGTGYPTYLYLILLLFCIPSSIYPRSFVFVFRSK